MTKNAEIQADQLKKQVDVLSKQNSNFQEQLNQATAKNDVLSRDLATQQEVMKQFEANKKEYINKLKHELDTVEFRFLKVINENNMIGEDIRSRAIHNLEKMLKAEEVLLEKVQELDEVKDELDKLK